MVSHSVNCFFQQDVESYDPILNPVLNRELRRTGGRVLITIGDQDIDLSPSFTIFLSTRDPTVGEIFGFFPFKHNTPKIWKGLWMERKLSGKNSEKIRKLDNFLRQTINRKLGIFRAENRIELIFPGRHFLLSPFGKTNSVPFFT